jgi:Ser/Thr protein kinase RdoA (MazF antagonist)
LIKTTQRSKPPSEFSALNFHNASDVKKRAAYGRRGALAVIVCETVKGSTMANADMPLKELLGHLENLARDALPLWDLPVDADLRLINVSENVTYLVEANGYKQVLRVHRENYHSHYAIECELAWLNALHDEGKVNVPAAISGTNGAVIQPASVTGLSTPRDLVMFEFLEGTTPDETADMSSKFYELGAIAARCHVHVRDWQKPKDFERLVWDEEAVFGVNSTWGNWRDAPGIDDEISLLLNQVETKVRTRLSAFGKGPDRFGLIHADMRLANLIIGPQGTQVIDFDDCGFGWFIYDFAAAISFIEDDPRVPDFQAEWLKGYRSVHHLSDADEAEIETMIMLRRMALLAWIGSHIEAPEPQALAPDFARNTAKLGRKFLSRS